MTDLSAVTLFSDIDGTLVHYLSASASLTPGPGGVHSLLNPATSQSIPVLKLPVSSTGKVGVISVGTLERFAALRAQGCKTVIISGARTSTILQRLGWLPQSDAYVTENGGRIFWADSSHHTAMPIREDQEWRMKHEAVCGPSHEDEVPPEQRSGALWELFRRMSSDGWKIDTTSYSTQFRVKVASPHTQDDLQAIIQTLPEGLTCSFNLGNADFYPSTSGKHNAAAYIMQRYGSAAKDCAVLCDDDNDMAMAEEVGSAYLPTAATEGVLRIARSQPEKFTVSELELGPFACEDVIDTMQSDLRAAALSRAAAAAGAKMQEPAVAGI